jgi:hypothetical protein
MTDNEKIVRDFIGAWSRLDVEEIVAFVRATTVRATTPEK